VVTLFTTRFRTQNFHVLPTQCIYMCCTDLRTAIVSLYSINWLFFWRVTSLCLLILNFLLTPPTKMEQSVAKRRHIKFKRRRITPKKKIQLSCQFVCQSAWNKLGSRWTDFHEILCLSIFRKYDEKIQVSLKSDKNKGRFTSRLI
jgi:hypothetical protein